MTEAKNPKPKRVRTGRVKSEAEKARNRQYQKEKYPAESEVYSKKRKERYDSDLGYKKAAKARAHRRYWLIERSAETPNARVPDIAFEAVPPKGTMPVVVDGVQYEVTVYTTAALPLILGRSVPTLRLWYKEGVLPEPYQRKNPPGLKLAKGSNPRLITEDELRIIYEHRDKLALHSEGRAYGVFTDAVTAAFADLTKGIRIE